MEHKTIDPKNVCGDGFSDRRKFLTQLTLVAAGAIAASSLLPFLENYCALAGIIPENDPRIRSDYVDYPGATGEIRADLVRPRGDAKVPGVIVIHEIWGLTPHIEDVARRLAVEGFLAIAPDALSPLGGSPEDPAKARPMMEQLDREATVKNYIAALKYLEACPQCDGNVGVIGFCWGGGMANQLAVDSPDLKAAVPFYGMQPSPEDVPKIKASLLLHYAGNDDRINKGIPAFEEALKKASIDYRLYLYKGVEHAFHNDTNAARYNKEAAQLAWKRTIEFLKQILKT